MFQSSQHTVLHAQLYQGESFTCILVAKNYSPGRNQMVPSWFSEVIVMSEEW
jgi:hypothetical protein